MADVMALDSSMKDDIRKTLVNIYGEHVVRNWSINEDVANTLLFFMAKNSECNELMSYVPRPFVVGNPISYIGKETLRKIFKRSADNGFGCMNTDKVYFRHKFEEVGRGI